MKKLSKILLTLICLFSLAGCNEADTKGSVSAAIADLENYTNFTINFDINVDLKMTGLKSKGEGTMLIKVTDSKTYINFSILEMEEELYITQDENNVCEISYLDEYEVDEGQNPGWYGTCEEKEEEDTDDLMDPALKENIKDEYFEYKDGYYVLNEEKRAELLEYIKGTDMSDFGYDASYIKDINVKVGLLNDKLNKLVVGFAFLTEDMKMDVEMVISLSKLGDTTIIVPEYTEN